MERLGAREFKCLQLDKTGKVCGKLRKTQLSMLGHFIVGHGKAADVKTNETTNKKEYVFRPFREDEVPNAWCRDKDVGMKESTRRWNVKTVDKFGQSTVKRGRRPKTSIPVPEKVISEAGESRGLTIDATKFDSALLNLDPLRASTSGIQGSNPLVVAVLAETEKDVDTSSQGSIQESG